MKQFFHKNLIFILAIDILLVAFTWYFAYLLRFNFEIPVGYKGLLIRILPLIVLIKIVIFYFFDLYRGMWRYTSLGDFSGGFYLKGICHELFFIALNPVASHLVNRLRCKAYVGL
jgi:FlaA1/EpsC-like NDP-sugar epimerase